MPKTVQSAFVPLLTLGAFCGLCVFEYPLERPRPYFSYLYFLILWSSYLYIYCMTYVYGKIMLISWYNEIILFSSGVSIAVTFFRFKDLKKCLHKLTLVDNTLKALGTPKEYRRLYKWLIGLIVAWFIICIFLNALDLIWDFIEGINEDSIKESDEDNTEEESDEDSTEYSDVNGDNNTLFIFNPVVVENFIIHVDTVNSLIFGTIMVYVSSRFARVNKHIYNMLENDTEHRRESSKPILVAPKRVIETEECRWCIWILMHLHLQLRMLSRQLNKLFDVQLTLEMAGLFVSLLGMLFEIYDVIVDFKINTSLLLIGNLTNCIWVGVLIAKLFMFNYACQTVCDKANETVEILYKLLNDNIDKDLREQTLQFILQIKQGEVRISGMGLFYLGNQFTLQFFTSMLSVLIIVEQMGWS